MNDLGFVFFERLLRLSESCDLGSDVVLALSQVKFNHAESLLDGDQFVVSLAQLVPGDQHLFDELFNGVSFEHPFECSPLIV